MRKYLGQMISCRRARTEDYPLDYFNEHSLMFCLDHKDLNPADENLTQAAFHFVFCLCIQKCSVDLNHLKPERSALLQSYTTLTRCQ